MSYSLVFFMDTKKQSSLEQGRMILLFNGKLIETYIATSGAPGWQDRDNVDDRGRGLIPSCMDANLDSYWVKTKAIPMPNKKGIEGNFYPITPFAVTVGGVQRSDFGIHADANVPGSAGCIVLPPKGNGWKVLQERMAAIAKEGMEQLRLVVVYS